MNNEICTDENRYDMDTMKIAEAYLSDMTTTKMFDFCQKFLPTIPLDSEEKLVLIPYIFTQSKRTEQYDLAIKDFNTIRTIYRFTDNGVINFKYGKDVRFDEVTKAWFKTVLVANKNKCINGISYSEYLVTIIKKREHQLVGDMEKVKREVVKTADAVETSAEQK